MNIKYGFKLSDCKEWQWKDYYWKKYWNFVVLNAIEKNIEKYWKSVLIEHYWKNIEKYWYWLNLQ